MLTFLAEKGDCELIEAELADVEVDFHGGRPPEISVSESQLSL